MPEPHDSEHWSACLRALRWRFGAGSSRLMPGSTVPASYGLKGERGSKHAVGSGNSAGAVPEPDVSAIHRFGHVDRALLSLAPESRQVLELAHGDIGAVVTSGGLHGSRRWRAIAHLTAVAEAHGAAWAARVDRQADGPLSVLDVEVAQASKATLLGVERAEEAPPRPEAKTVAPYWTRALVAPSKTDKDVEQAWRRRDLHAGPPAWRWVQWIFDPAAKGVGREDRSAMGRVETEAKVMIAAAERAFAAVYVPIWEDKR